MNAHDDLRGELECIASVELASQLDRWHRWSEGEAIDLRDYLRAELGDGGLLSAGHFVASGAMAEDRNGCRRIARQARSLLLQLEQEVGARGVTA
jgi:hypothetical protein